jgi:hypothetical protein
MSEPYNMAEECLQQNQDSSSSVDKVSLISAPRLMSSALSRNTRRPLARSTCVPPLGHKLFIRTERVKELGKTEKREEERAPEGKRGAVQAPADAEGTFRSGPENGAVLVFQGGFLREGQQVQVQ